MADKRFSILVDSLDYCIVCGKPHPHKHEVFFGRANRKLSIKYGLVIPLCLEHHEGNEGPHKSRLIDITYKCIAQKEFEKTHSRAEFISIFGKSYL